MKPIEIKLKPKYLHPVNGFLRSSHNDNSQHRKHKKVKLGYDKHVARYGVPPKKVMVMGPTGKCRMVLA